MDISDTTERQAPHVSIDVPMVRGDTGQEAWRPIPTRERKAYAHQLVEQALTGDRRRQARWWITNRRYSVTALENFIKRMEAALAAQTKGELDGPGPDCTPAG